MRSIAEITAPRTTSSYVLSFSLSVASSGMMFSFVPACSAPTNRAGRADHDVLPEDDVRLRAALRHVDGRPRTVAHDPDHTAAADSSTDLVAVTLDPIRGNLRSSYFVHRKFWVLMQVCARAPFSASA